MSTDPDGLVLFLGAHDGPDEVERWLDHLAAALASRAAEGVLTATRPITHPEWYWTPVGCGRWGS